MEHQEKDIEEFTERAGDPITKVNHQHLIKFDVDGLVDQLLGD